MSRLRIIVAIALSTAVLAGTLMAAEPVFSSPGAGVVDRVVASVNEDPVLASDVEDAAHIEALMQDKPAADVAPADLKAALDRLIDRALLRQQMSTQPENLSLPVRQRLAEIRAALPGADSPAKWTAILAAYRVDEQKLKKYLEDQLELVHFIDARLRPSADVSWTEIQNYYNQKLLPELKERGAVPEPLRSVQGRIREILLQQKIDAQLSAWLASLREQGRVRILQPQLETARGAGSGGRGTSFSILDRR